MLDNLSYEFWIEVVFFEPFSRFEGDSTQYQPDNPLKEAEVHWSGDLTYDASIIAEQIKNIFVFGVRDLFWLDGNLLYDSKDAFAKLWPGPNDAVRNEGDDVSYLSFTYRGDPPRFPDYLGFKAVKVCNSNQETELQLRAKIIPDLGFKGVLFFLFFFGLSLPLG